MVGMWFHGNEGDQEMKRPIVDPLRKHVDKDLRNMPATELAKKVGCSQPGLTQWLTGVRGLGTDLAEKLARYYKLTLQ